MFGGLNFYTYLCVVNQKFKTMYGFEHEHKRHHPKLFKNLFNLTAHDSKVPTDQELDEKIEQLGFYMRYVWPLLRLILKRKLWFFFRYKWKYWGKKLIVYSTLAVAIYFAWVKVAAPIFIKGDSKVVIKEIYVTNLKTFDELMKYVGEKESGNTWNMHRAGSVMLGYFQFDPSTLKGIGINVDENYFLNDSNLQIAAFKLLMHKNRAYFQKYITRWSGKPMPQDRRYVMTESGILMAFHLKPSGAVRYFESGCVDDSDTDGNGTPVSAYIKEFSGYKVEY